MNANAAETNLKHGDDKPSLNEKELQQFFAEVLHEIKNPLTIMNYYVQNLNAIKTEDTSDHRDKQHDKAIIQYQLKKLFNFINMMIDQRSLETGSIIPKMGHHELGEMLQTAITDYTAMAESKGIKISSHFEKNLPEALIDPDLFTHIIDNLMLNSIMYAQAHIWLSLEVKKGPHHTGDELLLTLGNDSPHLSRHDKLSILAGQMGLGLNICHQYSKLIGTEIDVKNLPQQKGVEFIIKIPTQIQSQAHKKTVLIIEDHIASLLMLSKRLKTTGYNCKIASNVEDAIRLGNQDASEPIADLVILDLGFLNTDGFAFLSHIKRWTMDHPDSKIPIIVVSGHNHKEIVDYAINLGASAFISKPYKYRDLLRTMESYLH